MEGTLTKLYRLTGIVMHLVVITTIVLIALTLRDFRNQFAGTPFEGVPIVEEKDIEVKVVDTNENPDAVPTFTPEPQEQPLGSVRNPVPLGTTVTMPDSEFNITVTDVILNTNMDGFEERVTAVGIRVHYTGTDLKDFMAHHNVGILGSKGQVKRHEAWGSFDKEILQGAQIGGSTVEGYRLLITEGEGDTLLFNISPNVIVTNNPKDVWFKLYQ